MKLEPSNAHNNNIIPPTPIGATTMEKHDRNNGNLIGDYQ